MRLSEPTAAEIGARDGEPITVFTERGEITMPLVIDALPERVVWLPMASPGAGVHEHLAATAGDVVGIRAALPDTEVPQ